MADKNLGVNACPALAGVVYGLPCQKAGLEKIGGKG